MIWSQKLDLAIDRFLSFSFTFKDVSFTLSSIRSSALSIADVFGNIAGNNNIPLIMLQKIFRHSKITTMMTYMANFIHKDADDALDAILNFKPVNN